MPRDCLLPRGVFLHTMALHLVYHICLAGLWGKYYTEKMDQRPATERMVQYKRPQLLRNAIGAHGNGCVRNGFFVFFWDGKPVDRIGSIVFRICGEMGKAKTHDSSIDGRHHGGNGYGISGQRNLANTIKDTCNIYVAE